MNPEINHKLSHYSNYLQLTQKQRMDRINNAQHEKYDLPDPHHNHSFPQTNSISFQVRNQKAQTIRLATYRYPAFTQPKAVVVMLHGMNSHIHHGAHIAHHFATQGIQTVGFDHRGFGQSEGQPGYMSSFQTHIEDCLNFVMLIKGLYPKVPLFCLGQSMGGLSSYHLGLREPQLFEGVIMMCPAFKKNISRYTVGLVRIMRSILPEYISLGKFSLENSNRNRAMIRKKEEDPFYYKDRYRLATIHSLLTTMAATAQTYPHFRCPFLIIQGAVDKSVDPAEPYNLYSQSPLDEEDKDILFYENMWHDIWFEPEIEEIKAEVVGWIEKRLKRKREKEQVENSPISQKKNEL